MAWVHLPKIDRTSKSYNYPKYAITNYAYRLTVLETKLSDMKDNKFNSEWPQHSKYKNNQGYKNRFSNINWHN